MIWILAFAACYFATGCFFLQREWNISQQKRVELCKALGDSANALKQANDVSEAYRKQLIKVNEEIEFLRHELYGDAFTEEH